MKNELEERLQTYGVKALNEQDLIEMLVPRSTSSRVVERGSLVQIAKENYDELILRGFTYRESVILVCSFELGRRRIGTDATRKKITNSKESVALCAERLIDLSVEHFYTLYLDRGNNVLKLSQQTTGGISGTVTDIRMIAKEGILLKANNVIAFHNHPSGEIKPSQADINLTENLNKGLKILNMKLLDHIIIGEIINGFPQYFSFADKGMLLL